MDPPNMGKPSNIKDQGMAKKKNKKEKKSKPTLTKGEREWEKLEKAGEEFRRNSREYGLFLDRMDKWLKTHHQQAMQLFCKYDKIENGILQYEEFKLGMRDLNIPCVEAQLHILARLLDPNNTGTIDYIELGAGIDKTRYRQSSIEEEEEEEDEAKEVETDDERTAVRGGKEERGISKEAGTTLVITKEELNRCPSCHLGLWNPVGVSEARYISLELRIISFNDVKCHPGHFQRTVYSHMKVYGLIGQIRGWTGVESTMLNIYRDHSCSWELSLEECGFPGGPHHSPTSALLYYDYCIEFSNCPILNCDHYINCRRL